LILILIACLVANVAAIVYVKRGIEIMTDQQTQALSDLNQSVVTLGSAILTATNRIAQLIAAQANMQPDDSAQIEAQVAAINNAVTQLNNTVSPPPAAPEAETTAAPKPTTQPPAAT
jgi:cell division septation protein DedD